ncbi:MAG: hypothetical protein AB1512_20785 [Thermodesulfobacteriota bacterium]
MRKGDISLALIGLLYLILFLLLVVHPLLQGEHRHRIEAERKLVATLGLTDLSLFTEARYTRHISQADSHAAFQDHPRAIEHFPSGSIVAPPLHLWARGEEARDFPRNKEPARK